MFTYREVPVAAKSPIAHISRSAGVLRTTAALGEKYQEELEELERAGYLCLPSSSSRTGRHKASTWLAPGQGWEGLAAWATEIGALQTNSSPPTILVREGERQRFVGRAGKTITAIAAHCCFDGSVVVAELQRQTGGYVKAIPGAILAFYGEFYCAEGEILGEETSPRAPAELAGLPTSLPDSFLGQLLSGAAPDVSGGARFAASQYQQACSIMSRLPGWQAAVAARKETA